MSYHTTKLVTALVMISTLNQAYATGCYRPINVSKRLLVCRSVEQNLNHFCDKPMPTCDIPVAPAFQSVIQKPAWKEVTPQINDNQLAAILSEVIPPFNDLDVHDRSRVKVESAHMAFFAPGIFNTWYRIRARPCEEGKGYIKADDTYTMYNALILAPQDIISLTKRYSFAPPQVNNIFIYRKKAYAYGVWKPAVGADVFFVRSGILRTVVGAKKYAGDDTFCAFARWP